jgi:ABC-type glycerol-3-phosphate transport system permease component
MNQQKKQFMAVMYVIATIIGVIMLVPFLWTLSTSLKSNDELFIYPPKLLPVIPMIKNYIAGWNLIPFPRYFLNSFMVSIPTVLLVIMCCSLAAFAFVRIPFKFRNAIFIIYLSTFMVPQVVRLIPSYIIVKNLGMLNQYSGMIVPQVAWFIPFGTFLIRQFLLAVPIELDEAAYIDGAGRLRIFWQIIMPNVKPAMLTLGIYVFISVWNNLIWMLVVTSKDTMRTVTLGLATMTGPSVDFVPPWNEVMAATIISILPVLVLFVFFQKYFIQSVALSGIKE